MSDLPTILPGTPKLIGIAADHGGCELKEYLVAMLRKSAREVIDFGDRQPKPDDDLNMICLGGLVVGYALAWELMQTFLAARFSGAERHRRRLAKITDLENKR